ncbi:MAG: HNH endonuclease [Anaerolineales bacterium]|nr:HNH endonuclease [Anaerolineales bacterium]
MKTIALTQGKSAIVDDEDYEYLSQFNWQVIKGYAYRTGARPERKHIAMHNEIMKVGSGKHVDHINLNPLDNRKENLRVCSFGQNIFNRPIFKNNKSGYKGVVRERTAIITPKWRAQIQVNKKIIYLGSFRSPEEAARVYDKAAVKYFGEFANLNFPNERFSK